MQTFEIQSKIEAITNELEGLRQMNNDEFFKEYKTDDRKYIIDLIQADLSEQKEEYTIALNDEEQDYLGWVKEMREITECY